MNKDFSLIDANIARVREGVRVLENVARFVIRHDRYATDLRVLRHELELIEKSFGTALVMSGRQGRRADTIPPKTTENERKSLLGIVRANANRATEALRSLEEFSRIYSPGITLRCEDIRYRVYTLEYQVISQLPHYWLERYFAEGVVYPLSDSVEELLWFVDRGAKIIQLRDKTNDPSIIFEKTKFICDYIATRQKKTPSQEPVLFILNDHVDIATRLPVSGIHIGQEDGEIARVRGMLGSSKIIGRSTHSLEQAKQAEIDGADYIGIGPVFATPTKAEREPIGLDVMKNMAAAVTFPTVAIGGVTPENVGEIYKRGLRNIAAIRSAREFFEETAI